MGATPNNFAETANGKPHATIGTARRPLPPPAGASAISERRLRDEARLLNLCCKWVQRAIDAGKPSQRTIERVARKMNGRRVRGGKRLRMSASTLRRCLWQWRKAGRAPAAWPFRYVTRHGEKLSAEVKQAFKRAASMPGCVSFKEAMHALNLKRGAAYSYQRLHRSLSVIERNALRRVHLARLELGRLEKRAAEVLR
jgi:hypothetical protein